MTTGLTDLVDDPHAGIDQIGSYLDRLDATTRWGEVSALGRSRQRTLFDKAAHAPAIDFAHFVGDAPARQEVIHDGVNTLPVPPALRRFQKRFCRPARAGERLFGYNEGPTRRFIGPGYFVAIPTADKPAWSARGAVVVDYFQIPDGDVAEGWPRVVDNHWRLQRFVYEATRDFMRRVSTHVSIGAAFKRERPLDHYFVLCRQASS
ncbi:MAG: hypothetical protein ABI678_00075 [Kofleriaceae bacterium]